MVPVELTRHATARTLVFPDRNDELLATMWQSMPPRGIAEANMPNQRAMPRTAYRLLNSRILETALGFLNEDVGGPLLTGLATCRALVQAAEDSRAGGEVLVTLIEPYRITSTHEPSISVELDGVNLATIPFELSIEFGMCETAVVVRHGAIEAIETETCSLGVTLTLRGWSPPLLQRTLPLRVRMPVDPPIAIPLPPREPATGVIAG